MPTKRPSLEGCSLPGSLWLVKIEHLLEVGGRRRIHSGPTHTWSPPDLVSLWGGSSFPDRQRPRHIDDVLLFGLSLVFAMNAGRRVNYSIHASGALFLFYARCVLGVSALVRVGEQDWLL